MGKRKGKKVQGGPSSNKMGGGSRPVSSASASSSTAASPSVESGRLMENGASAAVENTMVCPHVANLEKLRTQLARWPVIHCLDCAKLRLGVSAGKERKGKGKVVRKKLPSPSPSSGTMDGKNSTQKLWVCLSCGHVGCGAGGPNPLVSNSGGDVNKQEAKQGIVGRGHAWQHWLQLKHPMVMVCGDEFSCWCFQCELGHEVGHDHDAPSESGNPSPVEGEEEASAPPSRDMLLQQSAKLIREKLAEQLKDVKDDSQETRDGAEEVKKSCSPVESENGAQEEPEAPTTSKRVMKGLVNLGNTCFFNSVMQNLLSVELLRNHFGPQSDLPEGDLTSSLRKFFHEASTQSGPEANGVSEAGVKKNAKARGGWSSIDGIYNPKGLFGAICAKAPRFKGFQQQDSHELLRCLLDGLHTEEEIARRGSSNSKTGAGEDALRALSESEVRENSSNTQVDDLEDSGAPRQDAEVAAEEGDITEQKSPVRTETFVEQVFGGQLSSTVSCCVCGHSSVVYESFLDLSLPIPSKKPSKRVSAQENGSSTGLRRSQRVQDLKTSKANSKTDPDLEVFRSVPAGLGTPLLLLPPPPPKDTNGDYVNSSTGTDGGWLDYTEPGTESGETDWLDFLDDGSKVDPGTLIGCSSNPESQIGSGSAPSLESEIVFGCAPNLELMKQSSAISAGPEGNGILGPAADVIQRSVTVEQNGNFGGADLFSVGNGNVASQSLDIPFCEKFLLVEAAPVAISGPNNSSSRVCGSGLRPIWGQETDMQVHLRGGSETLSFDTSQEAELNDCPVVEQHIGTSASVQQSADCKDDTRLQSDIINGPNGTVILLGPPVDNGSADSYSNLDLDGEYDGVGSLFEEEASNENRVYGPLPSNQAAAGLEFEDSTYDDIVFDDVLDLSKINSEGRGDWLVFNEEKRGEENDEASMSLEGCLQIFTRSELLSGENAWACENCTKQYHENLETVLVKSPVTSSQKHQLKRTVSTGRNDCPDLSGKKGSLLAQAVRKSQDGEGKEDALAAIEHAGNGSSKDDSAGDSMSCDGHENGEVDSYGDSPSCGMDAHVSSPLKSGEVRHLLDGPEVHDPEDGKGDEACQGALACSVETVDNTSVQTFLEPVDLKSVSRREPHGELKLTSEVSVPESTQVPNFGSRVEVDEVDNHKSDAETNASELEKKGDLPSALCHGKTPKLKKSKSRQGPGEQRKVIKQDATKWLLISRAPPVLTIQLKRFAQDMRGRLSKLSGHIAFQEWLDLHPFLDRRYVNLDCKYRLIGTVEHSGTLKSGHYVAFVRGPAALSSTGLKDDLGDASGGASSWYYVSDTHVHQTNLEAVLQSEAYLVFYERVDIARGIPL